jgi:ATP-dependent exoDNAse (exonuclease V) beta subunit
MALQGTPNYLSVKNAHPRDQFISFEEGPHIYTVCGERGTFTSVTTWNHHHFSKFDADAIIDKMLANTKNMSDPKYKYYNMTKEQIKKMWDEKRDSSSGLGTKMHNDIELFYNGVDVKNDSIEFHYFRQFVKHHPELIPYRTEWMVYYEELKLSGSIDMVFENPDGTIQIYDWKRCQEIKHEAEFGKFAMTTCISHLPDTNFWHYALQLNTYKTILEHKYGKKVTDLYLVCIHPDNIYKTYDRIKVPFLEKEMKDLVKERMEEVNKIDSKNDIKM